MRRKGWAVALALWVPLAASTGETQPKPPYVGEVTGERVYIRAGDGINYTVMTVAQRGNRVKVKGRRFSWLAIDVPENCTVWVHKTMLAADQEGKEATVARSRVNIRARPGADANVLGQLPRGTRVQLVDEDGDWAGIAPPSQAKAWVHSQYVREVPTDVAAKPPAEQGMDAAAAAGLLGKAAAAYKAELAKPPKDRNFSDVLQAYQAVAAECRDEPTARRAEQTRQRLLKLVDLLEALKAARSPIEEFEKKYDALEAEYKRRAGQADKQ
jgi:uncharacterized protein YraI